MAYNRENLLIRIIEAQDIVLANQKKGITQKWTYENEIFPKFKISYSCFNEWMTIPAKEQLKQLIAAKEKKKEVEKRQMKLFED